MSNNRHYSILKTECMFSYLPYLGYLRATSARQCSIIHLGPDVSYMVYYVFLMLEYNTYNTYACPQGTCKQYCS